MKQGQLNLRVRWRSEEDYSLWPTLLLYNQWYYSIANVLESLLRAVSRPKTVQFFLRHQTATTASDETR